MMVFALNAVAFVVAAVFWSRASTANLMIGLAMGLLAMGNGSLAVFAFMGGVPQ